ncbi:MAG TPA: 1,2-phenylacetyl-CoA epoxidase subunit PaaE [Sphingobacteriaceae bacterium]|nr:1,2-phenylacetyl-CoA epoxidase subunit PaaE [Sphingobacteriaceae bacterium]
MSSVFYPLKVKDLRKETEDCVSVAFDVPLELRHVFAFQGGQHLIFRAFSENGEELRRNYSICVSPLDGELRVAVKRIPSGYFSAYVHDRLQVGDELEVSPPQGKFFTQIINNQRKHYVAVAAGSGITPIMSLIKSVLTTEKQSRFTLIYANKNKQSIIFRETLEALKNQYMDRLSIYHVLSREHTGIDFLTGRIDREKMDYFLSKLIDPKGIDEVFLCGPEALIFLCKAAFENAGVDEKKIHFELFYSARAETKKTARILQAESSGGPESRVTLKLDGSSMVFNLPLHGASILDAALSHGADLPYSCKGGVCATCKCLLEEGEVSMDVNYALEADELKRGFILACQSHPVSEQVTVNYDVK